MGNHPPGYCDTDAPICFLEASMHTDNAHEQTTPDETRYCGRCQKEVTAPVQILSSGVHYGQIVCPQCGKHLGFVKKPENIEKRAKNKHTAESLKITFCQLCLRPLKRLGTRGVLEVHHVIEIKDGGIDTRENIWVVCTSCHKLIHHQRTYLNNHLMGMYSLSDLKHDMRKDGVSPTMQKAMISLFSKYGELNA